MAAIDKLKKKGEPQVSIALLRMKPMTKDMMMQHDAKTASSDTGEDVAEGGVHPAGTEPAPKGTLAATLQDLLNTVSGYYITAHQFHWNVVGSDFGELHEFFGDVYQDAWDSLDPLAENIRKLDQMVDTEFGQPDECNSDTEMLNCLSDMNKKIINQLKDAIDVANKDREQGILNFLADRLDTHQKYQWQITAFLR